MSKHIESNPRMREEEARALRLLLCIDGGYIHVTPYTVYKYIYPHTHIQFISIYYTYMKSMDIDIDFFSLSLSLFSLSPIAIPLCLYCDGIHQKRIRSVVIRSKSSCWKNVSCFLVCCFGLWLGCVSNPTKSFLSSFSYKKQTNICTGYALIKITRAMER